MEKQGFKKTDGSKAKRGNCPRRFYFRQTHSRRRGKLNRRFFSCADFHPRILVFELSITNISHREFLGKSFLNVLLLLCTFSNFRIENDFLDFSMTLGFQLISNESYRKFLGKLSPTFFPFFSDWTWFSQFFYLYIIQNAYLVLCHQQRILQRISRKNFWNVLLFHTFCNSRIGDNLPNFLSLPVSTCNC